MTINPDEPVPLTCSDEDKERLKALARSTTAGIWRIKRAKALLGIMESIRPARLMYQVRVPVKSIVKCIEQFKQHGMAYFDEPERAPTEREERVEKMLEFFEKAPPFSCKSWDDLKLPYIGCDFSARQIFMIRQLIAEKQLSSRSRVALAVCEMLGLQGLNGKPPQSKVVDILVRMDMDNIIFLPRRKLVSSWSEKSPPEMVLPPVDNRAFETRESLPLTFRIVENGREFLIWKSMIHHYHYLHSHRLFGPQLRYIVYCGNGESAVAHPLEGQPLAALGFSSSAWRVTCRDNFIGWDNDHRIANLHLVIDNSRFLILPWVRMPNLASRILGAIARRVVGDWNTHYGRKPVLLETFVDQTRFSGTCYRAANWVEVGSTVGYSLHGQQKKKAQPRRSVFLLPLHKHFRSILCGDSP